MNENKNSKFSLLTKSAITMNFDDLVKDLFTFMGVINENLEIVWQDDPELMERIIRILTRSDIYFKVLNSKFTVINCPEDKKEEFKWFAKLFAYLESETSNWELGKGDLEFLPSLDCQEVFKNSRIELDLDISELKFLYQSVDVEFVDLPNYFDEFEYFFTGKR